MAQAATCLTADRCLTTHPGVLALSHIFMENFYGHSPPSTDSKRVVVSYKRKYVQEVLVNHFAKLAHEKVWLGELT